MAGRNSGLLKILVELLHQRVGVGPVGGARVGDGFGGGVRAAQAVHAKLHEDVRGAAVKAEHFADGGVFDQIQASK